MTDRQIERRVNVVGQGMLVAQALFAGLVISCIGVAVVYLGELLGLVLVAVGLSLSWYAEAKIARGAGTRWWNRTLGLVLGMRIDEAIAELAEPLDALEEVGEG